MAPFCAANPVPPATQPIAREEKRPRRWVSRTWFQSLSRPAVNRRLHSTKCRSSFKKSAQKNNFKGRGQECPRYTLLFVSDGALAHDFLDFVLDLPPAF